VHTDLPALWVDHVQSRLELPYLLQLAERPAKAARIPQVVRQYESAAAIIRDLRRIKPVPD
jgi:hypothetical protein